jgi:curved DNA-binding protein
MEYKDYYGILGLERTATQDEIKSSYRKLARKLHPDINKEPDAEAKFKELSEAYEVLGDAEKRAAYDQLGKGWQPGQEFRPPPDWDAGFEFSGASASAEHGEFSDFFDALFGNMRRQQWTRRGRGGDAFRVRGEDHHARILIDLADAFTGATRQVSLRVPEVDAAGHVVLRDRVLNVKIPRGVTEGQHIRLKGQGAPGSGAPAGDLYLEVSFKPDPRYRVEGRDLTLDLPVAPWEAALGASVKTPTPTGAVMLKIPPNSAPGRSLRIKGRGIPASGRAGDLYVVLKIVLPPADTETARLAYQEMAQRLAFDPRAGLKEGLGE